MISLLRVTLGLFLKDQWWYQYIGVMLYSYQVQIKGARIFGDGGGVLGELGMGGHDPTL